MNHAHVTGHPENAVAALRALAVAHGQPPRDDHAILVAEKHELHLHRNVHHACACAVLVVPVWRGIDRHTRLAALHARREVGRAV